MEACKPIQYSKKNIDLNKYAYHTQKQTKMACMPETMAYMSEGLNIARTQNPGYEEKIKARTRKKCQRGETHAYPCKLVDLPWSYSSKTCRRWSQGRSYKRTRK